MQVVIMNDVDISQTLKIVPTSNLAQNISLQKGKGDTCLYY